jgi:hypothetical protein
MEYPNTSVARAESQAPIYVGFVVNDEAMEHLFFFSDHFCFSLSVSLHQPSISNHLSRTL